MPDEMNGASLPEDQNQEPENNSQGDKIPGWMKEAGWEKDTGAFDESKPVFDNLEDEEEIVPAEIPAWLEEAAPEGFSLDSDLPDDKSSALVDDELIPISSVEEEELPPAIKTIPEGNESPENAEPGIDVPSWLKNLELDEDSQETAIAWLENMPDDLRATEEEKTRSQVAPEIIDGSDQSVDELEWIDDQFSKAQKPTGSEPTNEAKLSEDLVASDLLPEQQGDQLYSSEDLGSTESDIPSWLDELGSDEKIIQQPDIPAEPMEDLSPSSSQPTDEAEVEESGSLMPDWLSEIGTEEEPQDLQIEKDPPESTPVTRDEEAPDPDRLSDFEGDTAKPQPPSDSSSLAWLESLAEEQGVSDDELLTSPEERAKSQAPADEVLQPSIPKTDGEVSSNDDTLNTEIPDWLTSIADQESTADSPETPTSDEFDELSNWLDQITDEPLSDDAQLEDSQKDNDVLEWLGGLDELPVSTQTDDELRDSLTGDLVEEKASPDTPPTQDSQPEGMPDWLGELETDNKDDPSTLESAIRQSDHKLSEEEVQFLDRAEEEQEDNADWLAKLDMDEGDFQQETDSPAIKVDIPQEKVEIPEPEVNTVSGGILERLKDPNAPESEPEVPQWLENLKNEEDPQETAILWLKQFVEQGDKANISDEIKRYTNELDPGDTLPEWMEDLTREEDPQTTAMLWLEKLSGDREVQKPKPKREDPDEAGWLAELEKEEAEQVVEDEAAPSKDFQENPEGWLDDLEIDEKIKTEADEIPDWSQSEGEEEPEGETPPWMKATSPLDGDFYTDELAGSQEEVEIPDWLAGYAEGEAPEESPVPEVESKSEDTPTPGEDYTWVPAGDENQSTSRDPIDLNSAAISQLESIIGISYQVAKGIVTFREKNGFYKTLDDLMNVPEITDEQTIEILKPEVIIREVKKEPPKPPKPSAPVVKESPEKRLSKARDLISDSQIDQALEHYEYLIIKKKSIDEVIEDLIKASYDHPMDVTLMKTLGDAYMRVDKLEEALDAYSKAEDLLR